MELVLGEPLADLLDREPVLPTRRLLPILAQTARALHAAHVGGVVHRDVKPGNIILDRSGRVKITDFGISTATNQVPMTDSGMVMGTAQYLSPEQAIGRAATPASDIYSLGIVAYEALVGHRPFTGPTAVDIAVAHVNTPVPPMPPEIDPELSALVMRMLAKEPEERPRSAASLARVLDRMAEHAPAGGVPAERGRHARPVDVVDAVTAGGGLELGAFPGLGAPPGPRPTGEPARLVPGRDEAAGEPPASTPPAFTPPDDAETRTGGPAGTGAGAVDGDGPGATTDGTTTPGARVVATARRADARRSRATPDTLERAGQALRRAGRLAARWLGLVASNVNKPLLPVGTTTGKRWGRLSLPLLVLVLMVLFALLGAAFMNRLMGPSRAFPPAPDTGSAIVIAACSGTAHERGIIDTGPDVRGLTTTARDL